MTLYPHLIIQKWQHTQHVVPPSSEAPETDGKRAICDGKPPQKKKLKMDVRIAAKWVFMAVAGLFGIWTVVGDKDNAAQYFDKLRQEAGDAHHKRILAARDKRLRRYANKAADIQGYLEKARRQRLQNEPSAAKNAATEVLEEDEGLSKAHAVDMLLRVLYSKAKTGQPLPASGGAVNANNNGPQETDRFIDDFEHIVTDEVMFDILNGGNGDGSMRSLA